MNNIKKQPLILYLPIFIGVIWVLWWLYININNLDGSRDNFTDTYSIVALAGAVSGLAIAKKWGGFKSKLGRSLSYFSVGLGLQFLGQLIYGLYFRLAGQELAYPSLGDIPYFLSYIAYILAVANLLKVLVPAGSILKPKWVFLYSLFITFLVLFSMYWGFIHIAVTDERGLVYQVLNAAYPVIQSVYFLLGMIALLQSRLISGGMMFKAVFLLLFALIVQYLADFTFLYQSYHETWQAAGYNDLMFVIAYILMSAAILMIDRVRREVTSGPNKGSEQ